MIRYCSLALALLAGTAAWAQEGTLSVELNKLEAAEEGAAGCRAYFLFRNGTDLPMEAFELSLAILDGRGVIDRLLTIDAAPLPERRTTLKLFEIPEIGCGDISEIIVHDIPACRVQNDAAPLQCFDVLELRSLADAPLVN